MSLTVNSVVLLLFLRTFFTLGSDVCEHSDELSACYQKIMAFEAISDIHHHLDGDRNGEVDHSETEKFVQKEFSSMEANRKLFLNSRDPLISLLDLWRIWLHNPAYSWSVSDTSNWLTHTIELPQYEELFRRLKINGQFLPHLALQNMSFLTDVLGIRNPIHKKKIMLKALDVVLFGPPKRSGVVTNQSMSLFTMSIGLLSIFVLSISKYVYRHSHYSVHKCDKAANNNNNECSTETLSKLSHIQSRLEDVEKLRHSLSMYDLNVSYSALPPCASDCDLNSNGDNALVMHDRSLRPTNQDALSLPNPFDHSKPASQTAFIDEANNPYVPFDESSSNYDQLHNNAVQKRSDNTTATTAAINNNFSTHPNQLCTQMSASALDELTMWLKVTYQLELQHFHNKKLEAEKRLIDARQACARLYRKRGNILGSVLLMHTDNLDELENKLATGKLYLEELQREVCQRVRRWQRIEILTGLSIGANSNSNQPLEALRDISKNNKPVTFIDKISQKSQSFDTSYALTADNDDRSSVGPNELTKSISKPCVYLGTQDTPVPNTSNSLCERMESYPSLSAQTITKPVGSHNYSFVRPFAAMWRLKVKGRLNKNKKKNSNSNLAVYSD